VWIRQTTPTVKVPTSAYGKFRGWITILLEGEDQGKPEVIGPTHNPFTHGEEVTNKDFNNPP
jgi:hypothetical protein